MDPVIRLDKLTKHFGSETALDQVSLEVPPGVVFALLGENGAGKTTAIRIMLGLAEPNSGQAEVLGLGSAKQGLRIRQRVGYVAERPTLYEWMTVEEIGWFTAGFYGPGFLPEYGRLIAQFGLPPRKKLKTLSKGMHAKVVLSLALAHQPELLILDEPTSGLDAMVRREFLESMVDRAAQGQTVFLSSHQIAEVERVADIVAILRKGKLLLVEPLDATQGPGAAADRDVERWRRDAARAWRQDPFPAAESRGNGRRSSAAWPTSSWPRSRATRDGRRR